MSEMINLWLEGLSSVITANIVFAPLLALLAGILTSFTPCALSSIPLVIGYVGGVGQQDTARAFKLSLAFSLGSAVTFTSLGIAAAVLGKLMTGAGSWWYFILGVLMLLMALQTWEIYQFIPASYAIAKSTKKGYIGAMLAGILGGFFSSPCATPVLVVLLATVAKEGNLLWGAFLLLIYALGHSTLVLLAGTSVGFVQKVTASKQYGRVSVVLRVLMGLVILLIALYMFYLAF